MDLLKHVKKTKRVHKPRGYEVEWQRVNDPRGMITLLYLYLAIGLSYMVWRTTIVNWDVWYGPIIYGAEIYGFIMTSLFLYVTQRIYVPIHHTPKYLRKVDVLIPTYSEPLSVLEPVVLGATKIRGVNKVLVLDDGNRSEVKKLAKRLKVKYYARSDNMHAKAGNLNNGLKHTKAPFIITLDADHIPQPNFIERTLGYFDDARVGFVQSPQSFYNTNSFLFRWRRFKKQLWSEQMMFYHCIQPAKNNWNSAFFVGSSAMLRRSALDNVGGFATGTATEDIHTSLRLHANGWMSIFVPEKLAYGLESENMKEFYKQRRRWAAGSLGLLFRSKDSPLWAKGLTVSQRANYLSATLAHMQGVQKLCFFLVPIFAIFHRQPPVVGNLENSLVIFISFTTFAIFTTAVFSRGTYHILYTEAYALAGIMAHVAGLKGIIKVETKFPVSQKKTKRRQASWVNGVLPALFFMALATMLFGAWSVFVKDIRSDLLISSLVFLSINIVVLLTFLLYLFNYERKSSAATEAPREQQPHTVYETVAASNL
jgi:cellulose synthase/poly-beta-1,6-N-acetylglucosamine synthase-like glycosyltransferase